MGYKSASPPASGSCSRGRMKKVMKALDNKDLSLLTTMMSHNYVDPNKLIPEKGISLFHLIIGHQSELFAYKIAKIFLRYGGDPNVPSEDGVTPLHVAAAWGRTRIMHLLLVNGGDPWLQDDDKKNAFNYAFEEQEWDAIEMLHHFHQMHSSACGNKDVESVPKFELNFERMLLRKGDEMYEYSLPNDKNVKSTKTQTQEVSRNTCESPVLDKIKYFESSSGDSVWKKPERVLGWTKECYQTSCELMINSDESRSDSDLDKRHFVSSKHVDATHLKTEELNVEESVIVLENTSSESVKKSEDKEMDVRSRLFKELQEAVMRRSRADDGEQKKKEEVPVVNLTSSIIELSDSKQSISDKSVIEDSMEGKNVSYLYGGNFEENSLLKHMSDFATKVMNEIEVEDEGDAASNRASSNQLMTSTYLTCENESLDRDNDCGIVEHRSASGDGLQIESLLNKSDDSFLSITEEYKYTDQEEGVVLLEKKLVVTPSVSEVPDSDEEVISDKSSVVSDVSTVPSVISCASDVLRTELTKFGYNPGPINKTTKRLYLRKLWRLKKTDRRSSSVKKVYSPKLELTLKNQENFDKILTYNKFEYEMMRTFEENPARKWREGASKTSFNYLLLDPRISLNLPRRAVTLPDLETWNCFLSSIFYVGKGKRARPYAHLYEAASSWRVNCDNAKKPNEKIQYILDIWSDDLGVVCLHVFQNIIPVEAYTREAAMIDALCLKNLKNLKGGEYYGSAATWTSKDKTKLGVYLLYKAMLIFLNEGERQIKPFDIS